jgi:two-component system sensor histidine kinase VanS
MKISIFVKTFLILLFSFSLLFLGNLLYFYFQFSDKYMEENTQAVKQAILDSAADLENDAALNSTLLEEVSSETQFIRFKDNQVLEMIGPAILSEDEILTFVIGLYDSEDLITEGSLSYTATITEDIHTISYIYRFGESDYLLIMTKIQSLRNIGSVLQDISLTQGIFLFVTITLLSLLISSHITRPIKRINRYAKSMAKLDFTQDLILNRQDEFAELVTSLNEMAFKKRMPNSIRRTNSCPKISNSRNGRKPRRNS